MTVKIRTTFYSKMQSDWLPYIAVLDSEGDLTFEDFDEDYEMLMVSMGDEESPLYHVLLTWRDGTSTSMILNAHHGLQIDERDLVWLVLDYSEKAMKETYFKRFPYDPRPIEIIRETRELIKSFEPMYSENKELLDKLRYNVVESAKLMESGSPYDTTGKAWAHFYLAARGLWRIIRAISEVAGRQGIEYIGSDSLIDSLTDSEVAVAHSLSRTRTMEDYHPKYQAEFDRQNKWLRRRLHDILLERQKSGNWPPLEITP